MTAAFILITLPLFAIVVAQATRLAEQHRILREFDKRARTPR